MHLLALETSGPLGGIALADADRVLDEVRLDEGLRHGRDLVLTARDACHRAGWAPAELDAVALSIGPGSFTGLRIALVVAKVLAWDTGAAIVPVPTLRAMAENAPKGTERVACILDAKRGGLYASLFRLGGETPVEAFGPLLVDPAALAAHLPEGTLVLGRGLTKAVEALTAFPHAPEALWDPRPGVVARLGAAAHAAGTRADPLTLEPLYVRRPEAEEIWERRHGG